MEITFNNLKKVASLNFSLFFPLAPPVSLVYFKATAESFRPYSTNSGAKPTQNDE